MDSDAVPAEVPAFVPDTVPDVASVDVFVIPDVASVEWSLNVVDSDALLLSILSTLISVPASSVFFKSLAIEFPSFSLKKKCKSIVYFS